MAECTIEDLIGGMVNAAKSNPRFITMVGPNTPMLDVTDIVRQVYANVEKATLTIYGDPNRVRVIYKSSVQPSPQPVQQIVANWENGIEIERQVCKKDELYYLVQYPAKLDVKISGSTGDIGPMLLLLAGAAALALILSRNR